MHPSERPAMKMNRLSPARLSLVLLLIAACWSAGGCAAARGQRYSDLVTQTPLAERETLVIGFLGGRNKWNSERHGARRQTLRLRAMKLPGVHVETIENTAQNLAIDLIRMSLDRNGNGELDEQEKKAARIILFGQSFGGAAVNKISRKLAAMDVPVLLIVQVDSVGLGDGLVPANVAKAANFYQHDGFFIRGERNFRAADPQKTKILGNFEYNSRGKKIDISKSPWVQRTFMIAHTKMDSDPEMWAKVEAIILEEIRK
jgi:hypothetical protein